MKVSSLKRTMVRLLGAFAALFLAAQLNSADAVTIGSTSVLPNAISFEYFGLNFANNIKTSNTVGTLNYGGLPGCGGNCIATTALGSSPSVAATVNEVTFQNTSGGGVQATLGYYVAYLNTQGTYNVNLHATENLSSPDGAAMSAYLGFGPAATADSRFNNFASKTFEEADCTTRCPAPGFAFPVTGPFVADHLVSMEANTLYYLQLELLFNPTDDNVEISGLIDPILTAAASGGHFVFSAGVVSAVTPIPATLPLFASGLGGLGLLGWLRKRAAALPRRTLAFGAAALPV
jgi:hypothetical protein